MQTGKIFFGVIVLLIGIIFLVDTMGWVENAWRMWPLILILAAVFIFI
ncbi:LiaI-LiaF-like domain-containing protein, partial [Patescibacteria group bacterium]